MLSTNVKSNRASDSQQEKIVNSFVYQYLFNKISNNVSVINDKQLQLAGIDVIVDGKNYDLKAQSSKRYLNSPTNTFIVEISFKDSEGYRIDGWFLKDTITDDYVFIWLPNVKTNSEGLIEKVDDIERAEVMVVNKKSLYNAVCDTLEDHDFTYIEDALFDEEDAGSEHPSFICNGIKYVLSAHLYERPICAVLKKSFLKKYSSAHYLVTKDKITVL